VLQRVLSDGSPTKRMRFLSAEESLRTAIGARSRDLKKPKQILARVGKVRDKAVAAGVGADAEQWQTLYTEFEALIESKTCSRRQLMAHAVTYFGPGTEVEADRLSALVKNAHRASKHIALSSDDSDSSSSSDEDKENWRDRPRRRKGFSHHGWKRGGGRPRSGREFRTCYLCRQKGHLARDCPKASKP